jgi:AraC family transcriptional regulator of adaptative response/methylated-DNA-[protein]-cysteine methyltransferase
MGGDERNLQPQETMILCSIEQSPFGDMLMASDEGKVVFSSFIENKAQSLKELGFYLKLKEWKLVEEAMHQPVVQKLINNIGVSDLIHPEGTTFQKRIWDELMKIPAGETRNYLQVAIEIGSPSSARAVGTAIVANPIAWLIPCHRVIQTAGGLGGYRWGLERKKSLLDWERSVNPHQLKQFTQIPLFPDTGSQAYPT